MLRTNCQHSAAVPVSSRHRAAAYFLFKMQCQKNTVEPQYISDAFERWARMKKPNLLELSKELGYNYSTIITWRKKWNWQTRLDDRRAKAIEKTQERSIEVLAERKARQLKAAVLMQDRGTEFFENRGVGMARDAINAIDKGVQLQRLIDGETTNNVGMAIGVVDVDKMGEALDIARKRREARIIEAEKENDTQNTATN